MKNPKIVFVIFNTLDKKYKLLLENLEINLEVHLWSGFLQRKGIKNDLLLFLLSESKEKNNQTLSHLIDYCKKGQYKFIFISTDCPPEIAKKIKKKLNRKIYSLSSIEKVFHFYPNFYHQFYPNFKYKIFGTKEKLIPKTVSLLDYGCSYLKDIKNNYFYKSLNWRNKKIWKGCAYCSSTLSYKKLSPAQKIKILEKQIKYFQKELPFLKIIEIPSPFSQDFLRVFPALIKKINLESLSFYVFFRPDDLVHQRKRIEDLLKLMKEKGCSFFVENIGFENFSRKELSILNRGYEPETNIEALKTFLYFKNKYPKTWITENTSASFILFEPFTDIEDLKLNIARIAEFKEYFLTFNRISFNKLRIYKDMPIYYLAEKAGLILKPASKFAKGDLDYHFQNPKIEKIYKTCKKLFNASLINNQNQRVLFALTKSLELIDGF